MIKGSGDLIQTGGNKVSDLMSHGFDLTSLVQGSQYQLGMFFEIILNLQQKEASDVGVVQSFRVTTESLEGVIAGFNTYLEAQGVDTIDSLVIR